MILLYYWWNEMEKDNKSALAIYNLLHIYTTGAVDHMYNIGDKLNTNYNLWTDNTVRQMKHILIIIGSILHTIGQWYWVLASTVTKPTAFMLNKYSVNVFQWCCLHVTSDRPVLFCHLSHSIIPKHASVCTKKSPTTLRIQSIRSKRYYKSNRLARICNQLLEIK